MRCLIRKIALGKAPKRKRDTFKIKTRQLKIFMPLYLLPMHSKKKIKGWSPFTSLWLWPANIFHFFWKRKKEQGNWIQGQKHITYNFDCSCPIYLLWICSIYFSALKYMKSTCLWHANLLHFIGYILSIL